MNSRRQVHLKDAVNQLIIGRKFTVAKQGKDITLVKMMGRRPVTINLQFTGTGFWIENPERDDRSANSYLDYTVPPKRVTRNKDFIKFLVKHLGETTMWQHIENKNFFQPNQFNKKAKKRVVLSLVKSILDV